MIYSFKLIHSLVLSLLLSSIFVTPSLAQSNEKSEVNELNVIGGLLEAKRYADADRQALLFIERALQKDNAPSDYLPLGKLLQAYSRFKASKAVLDAALETYTREGQLLNVARSLLHLASAEQHLSNYVSAEDYLRRALSIAEMRNDRQLKAEVHLELGVVYKEQDKLELALEPLKLALAVFRDNDNVTYSSLCLSHIGDIYGLLGHTTLAFTYYDDAYSAVSNLSENVENKRLLGMIKSKMGSLQLKDNEKEGALQSITDGLDLLLSTNDVGAIFEAKMLMGKALLETGDTVKGTALLQEAMSFALESGQIGLVNDVRLALAQGYMREQKFDRALIYARAGTVDARKHGNLRDQLRFLAIQLSANVSLGDFEKALDIQSVVQELREALLNSETQNAVKGLQAEIELVRQSGELEKLEESKQLVIAKAEREKLKNTLFWSASVAVLLMLFLMWSRFKQRQQTIILRREVRQQTETLQEKNSELEQAYKTLEHVSLRDPLTGLYNRHYLESQLPSEIKRSQVEIDNISTPSKKRDLLCLLIDIDHFKSINDDYGHLAGDKVLEGFSSVLKEVFRHTDLIIRWGGEEFLVVCRHSSREELPELAERCRATVASNVFNIGDDKTVKVTCSIGFSLLPPNEISHFDKAWQRTFAVVDYALYAAKLSGRNGWIGLIETYHTTDANRTPLDCKFDFPSSRIATSFNNIASIQWPEEVTR